MDLLMKKCPPNVEEFKLCKNDEDRVKLMLDAVYEPLHITNMWLYGKKSRGESEKFRHSGNLLFNSTSPDLEEVLKLYSKSILYAPPRSEELSLAYANRSAVLFRGKYYEECLEDISRALETGYPDSLKPKLLIRRATCNHALTGNVDFEADEGLIEARALIEKLPATNKVRKMVEDTLNNFEKITSVGRQVKKTCPKYQPEMKGRNPHLLGASDAVALRYSEEYGRHLVATRNINSGEALLIEKPYATLVTDEWIYCICSYCARRTWNGMPCDNCTHAMFCSAECKQAAWEEYHDIECKILGIAKMSNVRDYTLMGLRITVKAIKEAGSVETLRKRLKRLNSVKASDVEIPINPNSYETFYSMSDSPESQEQEELMTWSAIIGTLTYFLAVKTNLFGKQVIGGLQIVTNSEQLLFVAGLMLKNARIAQNRTYQWQLEAERKTKNAPILSIIPISSFLNSRCYDAAELLRFDENVILVTYVPINKGDQIFTNYGADYLTAPTDSRRQIFNDGWQFDCNCLACKDNWSASTSTDWDKQDLSPRIMEELHNEVMKFEWPSLEETMDPITKISAKERYCQLMDFVYPRVEKPCIDVEQLVDVISQIYWTLGSMVYSRFVDES